MTTRITTRSTAQRTPGASAPEAGSSSRPVNPSHVPTNPLAPPNLSLSNDGGDDSGGNPDGDGPDDDGDDDNDDGLPVPPNDTAQEFNQLLQAITALRPVPTPNQKAKLREPDAFDGSDSRKLRTFLALCQPNF